MNRRIFLLVGLVIVALAIVAAIYIVPRLTTTGPAEPTPEAAEETVSIIVAQYDLYPGLIISEEHFTFQDWPVDLLPPAYITDPEQVLGYVVRADILQGTPLAPAMLATSMEEVHVRGSEVSQAIGQGQRAYAIPMDLLGAVAWTIEPGDHVDVLISWTVSDVDEEFQSTLPNLYVCVGGETCQGTYGRMELLPTGQTIMVYPSGEGAGRYIAQATVQDAIVLGIGEYELTTAAREGTTRPPEGGEGGGEGEAPPAAAETPSQPRTTQAVILLVDAQDALVLKALTELQADIDFALRSPDEEGNWPYEPVSLDYLVTRFNITPPPKLPYTVGEPGTSPLEREVERAVEATSRPPE